MTGREQATAVEARCAPAAVFLGALSQKCASRKPHPIEHPLL
jgi:hypothetical protein